MGRKARRRRKLKSQPCVYCLGQSDTREHVLPRSWFGDPPPPNLITVPCCEPCNSGISAEQEYARAALLLGRRDQPDTTADLREAVLRGLNHHGLKGPTASIAATRHLAE